MQRTLSTLCLATALLSLPPKVFADPLRRLEFEGAAVWTGRNTIQSPADDGTLFSLRDLGNGPDAAFRIQYEHEIAPSHELRFVYAPLVIKDTGSFERDIIFEGETYEAGKPLSSRYQFSTYRASYRYGLIQNYRAFLKIGGTLLVRDAKIEISSDGRRSSTSDVGIVPLLHLSGGVHINESISAVFEGDAVAAPQGRAIDLWLGIRGQISSTVDLGAGYRIIEGGADNNTIYSFGAFHFATVNMGVRF